MSSEEQLGWERRMGKPAAAAAAGAALFTLAAGLYPRAVIGTQDDGSRGALVTLDANRSEYFVIQALQAIALLLAGAALFYLLRCALARRPEIPKLVLPLVILGPLLAIVGGILSLVEVQGVADEFVSSGARTEKRAEDLLSEGSPVGSLLGLVGSFCIAVSFVLVGLNAMRAGLLSRFMGILGVVVGALLVLGLGPIQSIVQAFWFGALAALFLDRWPNGRGPAWDVTEPIPWPSARDAATGSQAGAIPADDPTIEPAGKADDPRSEPAPAPRKRSRKRRR